MATSEPKDDNVKDEVEDCDKRESGKKRRKEDEEDEEEELERLALETLLRDAKRNKSRAERMGATGWYEFPRPKTNKRFARNIVKSAVLGNAMKKSYSSQK